MIKIKNEKTEIVFNDDELFYYRFYYNGNFLVVQKYKKIIKDKVVERRTPVEDYIFSLNDVLIVNYEYEK